MPTKKVVDGEPVTEEVITPVKETPRLVAAFMCHVKSLSCVIK